MEQNKKFLIIGNMNAITYSDIFPHIKRNELWLGVSSFNRDAYFKVPKDYIYADTYKFKREINNVKVCRVAGVCWFTNIPHSKRNEPLDLFKKYNPTEYPKYDNYDAFECSKTANIPMDDYIEIEINEDELDRQKSVYGDDLEIIKEIGNIRKKIKIRIKNPIYGVPITFLDKYCPTQFEIVDIMTGAKRNGFINGNDGRTKFYINNKGVYARILIKRVSE